MSLWQIKPLADNVRSIRDVWDFFHFLDMMAQRWLVGHYRYGDPHRRKKYITKLKLELEAYETSGNKEHLLNVANYAYLESKAPQNERSHWNAYADSVTRGKG